MNTLAARVRAPLVRLLCVTVYAAACVPAQVSCVRADTIVSVDSGYQTLDRFMQGLTGFEAQFRQILRDGQGRTLEESAGRLAVKRPNQFRWDYAPPHAQTVVSDGKRLWLYDPELEQVTVRKLNQSLAGTPAMLLSGEGTLRDGFEVEHAEQRDGLLWVDMQPKRPDTDFRRVRLAFRGETLAFMELADKLGQTTLLEFTGVTRNPTLGADRFTFVPPAGADVIGGDAAPAR